MSIEVAFSEQNSFPVDPILPLGWNCKRNVPPQVLYAYCIPNKETVLTVKLLYAFLNFGLFEGIL